ncbi:MAG: cation:proton antiporter [Burkholderiaceae bacterium]
MDFTFLPNWPPDVPAALAVAALALLAAAAGEGAARLRLPRLFGYVAAGALFGAGSYVLRLLQLEELPSPTLQFTLEFTAAVILFDLGQRVSFGWVRRNPALLASSVAESALSFAAVFYAMRFFGIEGWAAAVIASIAIASSPAVVLAVTREVRSQGQVTERTLLLTALNSIYAVMLSTLLLALAREQPGIRGTEVLVHPAYLIVGSLAVAALGARVFLLVLSFIGRDRAGQILVMLAVVWLVFAASVALRLTPLLALLACGAFVRAFDTARLLTSTEFGLASGIALVLFFALSAAMVDVDAIFPAWLPVAALIVVRAVTKAVGVSVFGPLSGVSLKKGLLTGVGLMPMSALALMLIQQVSEWNPQIAQQTASVLLPSVVILQLIGALGLVFALRWSGETRTDR